jgi:hypothetical protein
MMWRMKNLDLEEEGQARLDGSAKRTGDTVLAVKSPIETEESLSAEVQVNHVCSFPSIPARLIGWYLMAGLLARECLPSICLPVRSCTVAWRLSAPRDGRQSAYSCGGSHGLDQIGLTVFPINPLRVIIGEPSEGS